MLGLGSRGKSLVGLGFFLARRGMMAVIGVALTLSCVVGFAGVAVVVMRRHRPEALPGVPLLGSTALAYGVGVLVAFAVSTRAFRRDEDDGVRALLAARGVSTNEYLAGRVAGLGAALAILVAGGSSLIGFAALLTARSRATALHTVQASVAAVAFSLAFAVTFAPVAMATLGARSRGGGYLALLAVLVLPDLAGPFLEPFVSARWLEVCSIPGALFALRTSLAPVGIDWLLLGRAVMALLVVIIAALALVRAEILRGHGLPRDPERGRRAA